MRKFNVENKIFIRSNNSSSKMLLRYTYMLFLFVLFLLVYFVYSKNYNMLYDFTKTLFVVSFIGILFQYFINLSRKKKGFSLIFTEDNILASTIIISLFSYKERLIVSVVAMIISQIARLFNRNVSISSSLYGILFILIYQQFFNNIDTPLINFSNLGYTGTYDDIMKRYGSALSFFVGTNLIYLSPILCIISFIFLFFKKSIKYSVVFSFLLTFGLSILLLGFIDGMNIGFIFFQLVTGNILFLSIFALPDYRVSPISYEGGVIYGIIIAILTLILRYIIPELSLVISIIIGQIFIVRFIDKISYKLKYNRKFFRIIFSSCIVLAILCVGIIYFIY